MGEVKIRMVYKNPGWTVKAKKRKNLSSAYQYLERLLLAKKSLNTEAKLKEKTSVLVVYDQILDYTNETEKSDNPKYLLKLTAQFLEDYAEKDWGREKEIQYGN